MPTPGFFSNRQGFSDVARRLALGMGGAPPFRDFMEDAIARQQLPFQIAAARGILPTGGVPFHQFVDSPAAFEQFIRGNPGRVFEPSAAGQSLRDAASFLRQSPQGGLGVDIGQNFLRGQLLGHSGSVGTELFAPAINLALQDTGSRFLPGLGAAARRAVANALQNVLAQEPGRFTDLPAFVDFLAQEGVI